MNTVTLFVYYTWDQGLEIDSICRPAQITDFPHRSLKYPFYALPINSVRIGLIEHLDSAAFRSFSSHSAFDTVSFSESARSCRTRTEKYVNPLLPHARRTRINTSHRYFRCVYSISSSFPARIILLQPKMNNYTSFSSHNLQNVFYLSAAHTFKLAIWSPIMQCMKRKEGKKLFKMHFRMV